ncbi:MAG: ABC transporter ATP-binding protein [Planctomycetes bacterium]|nr:ABC transporter ATP-binding protein [Planctomycetota bacterium]
MSGVPPALDVQELVKVYPSGVRAVDGVSFAVEPGEVFALLGPNGAGKTTTIRIVATLLRPTSGAVRVLGHDVVLAPDQARAAIGYVPQEVALDRHLTARQHLELSGRLYRVPAADLRARVGELLALVELSDRADEPVKRFSGGMKKRLDLACGLLHRPRLLILDEPTVGLDIQTRLRIWRFVAELRAQGTAILLTTHDMEEADELADRVAIVDHGRVQALGTAAALKAGFGGEMVKADLGRAELDAPALEALRGLEGVSAVERRGRALLFTTAGARDLAPRVAAALEARGAPARALSFGPPTLDDVFLKITGHAIRDEA